MALALLLACAGASAQIVTSTSRAIRYQDAGPSKLSGFVKAGFSVMTLEAEGAGAKVGYNVVVGLQRTIGNVGIAYYGAEVGLGSRGWGEDDYGAIAHNVQCSPLTFGCMIPIGADKLKLKLDPHLGIFASVDYISRCSDGEYAWDMDDYDDYCIADCGMNLGIGLWWGRYNFDVTYQQGFVDILPDSKSANVLFRLGVAF